MQYGTLGSTGLQTLAITMATFAFRGLEAFGRAGSQGVKEAPELVDICLSQGVNRYDTANMNSLG